MNDAAFARFADLTPKGSRKGRSSGRSPLRPSLRISQSILMTRVTFALSVCSPGAMGTDEASARIIMSLA